MAVLLSWRWEDLDSTPSVDILDFSLLFFDFGFYRGIDFLRGMVEYETVRGEESDLDFCSLRSLYTMSEPSAITLD